MVTIREVEQPYKLATTLARQGATKGQPLHNGIVTADIEGVEVLPTGEPTVARLKLCNITRVRVLRVEGRVDRDPLPQTIALPEDWEAPKYGVYNLRNVRVHFNGTATIMVGEKTKFIPVRA